MRQLGLDRVERNFDCYSGLCSQSNTLCFSLTSQIDLHHEPDMGPIYRDIVVGPKYRPFSDISLCICCVFDRTFPEDIVVVSFMT